MASFHLPGQEWLKSQGTSKRCKVLAEEYFPPLSFFQGYLISLKAEEISLKMSSFFIAAIAFPSWAQSGLTWVITNSLGGNEREPFWLYWGPTKMEFQCFLFLNNHFLQSGTFRSLYESSALSADLLKVLLRWRAIVIWQTTCSMPSLCAFKFCLWTFLGCQSSPYLRQHLVLISGLFLICPSIFYMHAIM